MKQVDEVDPIKHRGQSIKVGIKQATNQDVNKQSISGLIND